MPFGRSGGKRRENQLRQDRNAAHMSEQAAAARVVTKASKMYRTTEWDLVDAVESGVKLEEVDATTLPAPMREMNKAERRDYVQKKADQRQLLRAKIHQLGAERATHIATERARSADSDSSGFSAAMKQGLRAIAGQKGLKFNN